jgi:hypothetical protein
MSARIGALPPRRLAALVVGLVISAVALAVCLQAVDPPEVLRRLGTAQAGPLIALLALLAVQTWVRAVRWGFLLPMKDGARIPARRTLPPLLVGYLGNAVLPARLGEPTRALLVARRENVPGALAFGSVVLERIIDMAVLALVMLPAAWLAGAPRWIVEIAVIAAIGAGAVLVVLVFVGLAAPGRWLDRAGAHLGHGRAASLASLAAARLAEFASGAGAAGRRPALAVAALLTALAWLMDASLVWLAAASLGIPLGLADALVICGVAVLGTAIPSAPGYVGTYELAASAAAVALGIAPESALALAIVVHAMTLLPIALSGVVAFLLIQREVVQGSPTASEVVAPAAGHPS